jgi:hypothetical protein
VGALDLPSEPEGPVRAERIRDGGEHQPKARDLPDPDERGRVYEAMRTHVSAETRDEPGGRYWDKVPRFLDQAAELGERWSAERRAVPDSPDDPPGSFRSDGGFYLNPERHAEAVAAIDRVRKAEPGISADLQAVERENKHGGWLQGLEFCRKGDDRLKEKVAEQLKAEPRMTAGEVLCQVPDAIRYTFCMESPSYARGYCSIKAQLESHGYEMYLSKNSWSNREYKGINTRWVTQDGQRFEVQFHTPESFHAKQKVTHDAYEQIRNPMTPGDQRKEWRDFQRAVSAAIQVPDGAAEIPDYKKEGF